MPSTFTRTAAAVLAASAITGGLLGASPASAHNSHPTKVTCTVTAEQRAADVDRLKALQEQLRGAKLTKAERHAYRNAVAELVKATLDAKMPAAERQAKVTELRALVTKLRAATTAEERTAIRAEIDAIKAQLDAARLTKAELTELRATIAELRTSLTGKLSKGDRAVIAKEIAALAKQLRCKVAG
jgi:chromosome segregation ATPase